MNRVSTFWVPGPDDDQGRPNWLRAELREEWYATDGDKAILPVTKTGRNGEALESKKGLLVQFGGAELLLDVVNLGLEVGEEFCIVNPPDGRPYIDEAHEPILDEDEIPD